MIVFFPQPTIDLKCLNGSLNQTLLCILCDSDCILLPSKPIIQSSFKKTLHMGFFPDTQDKKTSRGLPMRCTRLILGAYSCNHLICWLQHSNGPQNNVLSVTVARNKLWRAHLGATLHRHLRQSGRNTTRKIPAKLWSQMGNCDGQKDERRTLISLLGCDRQNPSISSLVSWFYYIPRIHWPFRGFKHLITFISVYSPLTWGTPQALICHQRGVRCIGIFPPLLGKKCPQWDVRESGGRPWAARSQTNHQTVKRWPEKGRRAERVLNRHSGFDTWEASRRAVITLSSGLRLVFARTNYCVIHLSLHMS